MGTSWELVRTSWKLRGKLSWEHEGFHGNFVRTYGNLWEIESTSWELCGNFVGT